MFNGSRNFTQSLFIESSLGAIPQRLATLGIHYQNNPFLGTFQLKFCLKTFETCRLLKCNILAIILFEYLVLDPSAKRGHKLSREVKNCTDAQAPCPLLPAPMGPLRV